MNILIKQKKLSLIALYEMICLKYTKGNYK